LRREKSTDLAVRNDAALTAHTGTELTRPRPRMKVFHGFFLWQFLHGTFDTNLSHINTTNNATAHWLNTVLTEVTAEFTFRLEKRLTFSNP